MRKYDDEFKRQAVRKILAGQSVASVSRELGVAEGVLHNWKKAKLEKSSSAEQEVLELKKRLKEVEMENEILKKAALIFGRGS
jgi:transposase